jgi:hypothetical protein
MNIRQLKNELEKYPNHADVAIGGLQLESVTATRDGNTIDFAPSFVDAVSSPRSEPDAPKTPKASPIKTKASK